MILVTEIHIIGGADYSIGCISQRVFVFQSRVYSVVFPFLFCVYFYKYGQKVLPQLSFIFTIQGFLYFYLLQSELKYELKVLLTIMGFFDSVSIDMLLYHQCNLFTKKALIALNLRLKSALKKQLLTIDLKTLDQSLTGQWCKNGRPETCLARPPHHRDTVECSFLVLRLWWYHQHVENLPLQRSMWNCPDSNKFQFKCYGITNKSNNTIVSQFYINNLIKYKKRMHQSYWVIFPLSKFNKEVSKSRAFMFLFGISISVLVTVQYWKYIQQIFKDSYYLPKQRSFYHSSYMVLLKHPLKLLQKDEGSDTLSRLISSLEYPKHHCVH